MKLAAIPALLFLTALASQTYAGPLKEAKISQIINDVKVVEPRQGARPAILQDVIKNDLGVATGIQSRAELLFQDDTLTRLGAETFFSFEPGTRNLNLDRGSMLLQVPKNLGGARIRAASVSASITGTTITVEHLAGSVVRIVVLEGSLNVGIDRRPGENVMLRAGKMVVVSPDAKELPIPVDVNLRKLVHTSSLIDAELFTGKSKGKVAALPSMGLIEKEMVKQDGLGKTGALVAIDAGLAPSDAGNPSLAIAGQDPLAESMAKTELPLPIDQGVVPAASGSPEGTKGVIVSVTPPPVDPGTVTPPPVDPGTVTPPPVDPGTVTPPPVDPGTVTPPPVDPGTVTPPPVDPGTTTPPPVTTTPPPVTTTPPPVTTTPPIPTAAPVTMPGLVAAPASLSTPYPRPDLAAIPAVPPVTTTNPPPVTNATISLNSGATLRMDNKPSIQGVTGNLSGAVYAGALADGSAGAFLYGAASTYDAQRNLDGRFGVNYEPAFPSAGIAVYKFSSLLLDGPAQFRANNRFDVALIGAGGVSNSLLAPSFTMDTSALHSLFIGTENGGLSLSAASISATANSTFRFLQLYGRGSGSMSIDSTLSLPTANLFVDAPGNLSFGGGSSVTVDKAVINAGGTINANGFITANTLQFYSETAVQMKKKLGNIGVLNVFAPRFSTTAPIAVNGGVLDIGTGGIDAKDLSLTGFDSISTQGSIDSGNLLARGNISAGGSINIDPSAPATISATNIVAGGGIESSGDAGTLFPFAGPEAGGTVTIDAAQVVFDSAAINGANLDGGDVGLSLATDGGNGGTLNVGTAAKPIAGKVWIGARISATTGANASTTLTGGNGGTVNVEAADSIAVTSTVKVSGSAYVNDAAGNPTTARTGRGSSRGGNISLHSTKTTGTAISVQSSAQLLSLLSAAAPGPGGTIKFVAEGGDISVDNGNSTSGSTTSTGKIRADKGTVDIHNNGADGRVLVNNANIRGDVVKIGALGANGQLIIGGGTISADTSLKLYGGTSNGQVRFVDNVTLGGESTKIIAGKTVQIDSNKTVTVGGSAAAQVFTDKANYTGSGGNGSTTGKFGGAGATTQGLTGRPSF